MMNSFQHCTGQLCYENYRIIFLILKKKKKMYFQSQNLSKTPLKWSKNVIAPTVPQKFFLWSTNLVINEKFPHYTWPWKVYEQLWGRPYTRSGKRGTEEGSAIELNILSPGCFLEIYFLFQGALLNFFSKDTSPYFFLVVAL